MGSQKNLIEQIKGISTIINASHSSCTKNWHFLEKSEIDFSKNIYELAREYTIAYSIDDCRLEKRMISTYGGLSMTETAFEVDFIRQTSEGLQHSSAINTYLENGIYRHSSQKTIWEIIQKGIDSDAKSMQKFNIHSGLYFIPLAIIIKFHVINEHEGEEREDEFIISLLDTKKINRIKRMFTKAGIVPE